MIGQSPNMSTYCNQKVEGDAFATLSAAYPDVKHFVCLFPVDPTAFRELFTAAKFQRDVFVCRVFMNANIFLYSN